ASAPDLRATPPQVSIPAQPPPSEQRGPANLQIEESRTGQTRRIELNKEVTRIGRDPEGEVVIEADAAVVSRRHAEIKFSEGQYWITDLKSFNGTLVKNQRITE